MKRIIHQILSFVLLVQAFAALSAEVPKPLTVGESQKFFSEMRSKLQAVKSIKMTINQKRVLKAFMDELKTQGILYFKAPDQLRWETTSPYKTLLIYSKKTVSKFDFDGGVWRKLEFGAADLMAGIMENIVDWTSGKFEGSSGDYKIGAFSGYKLVLTPKATGIKRSLSAIELKINPKSFHIETVTLREGKGDYVEITLLNGQENIKLNESLFNLNQPSI